MQEQTVLVTRIFPNHVLSRVKSASASLPRAGRTLSQRLIAEGGGIMHDKMHVAMAEDAGLIATNHY